MVSDLVMIVVHERFSVKVHENCESVQKASNVCLTYFVDRSYHGVLLGPYPDGNDFYYYISVSVNGSETGAVL